MRSPASLWSLSILWGNCHRSDAAGDERGSSHLYLRYPVGRRWFDCADSSALDFNCGGLDRDPYPGNGKRKPRDPNVQAIGRAALGIIDGQRRVGTIRVIA